MNAVAFSLMCQCVSATVRKSRRLTLKAAKHFDRLPVVTAVYAVGDVAEFDSRVRGLWPVAVEQAEVAARNLLGENVAYKEPVLSTVLKVVGIDVFSVGQYDAKDGDEVVIDEDTSSYRYRKIVIRDGYLLGAVLIGWPSMVDVLGKAAKCRQNLGIAVAALRAGDWSYFDSQLLHNAV